MSNQPEQPQPEQPAPADYTPPGYTAASTPPPAYVAPVYIPPNYGQPNQAAPDYGQPPVPNYAQANQAAPNYGQPPAPNYGQPPVPGAPYAQQQNPYAQPQYPAPVYYPGYVEVTSGPRGMSLASMIIGLASLFVVGWFMVPQIVGVILGHIGLRKESPQGRPFSITGLITNYLSIAIYGAIYAFIIFGLAMMGFDSTGYEEYNASLITGV